MGFGKSKLKKKVYEVQNLLNTKVLLLNYYIKWGTTSWTYSTNKNVENIYIL